MKKIISFLIISIFSFIAINSTYAKYQKWYFKKNWTYVSGYFKTEKNKTKIDNYSTSWNTNPYTWKKWYKKIK